MGHERGQHHVPADPGDRGLTRLRTEPQTAGRIRKPGQEIDEIGIPARFRKQKICMPTTVVNHHQSGYVFAPGDISIMRPSVFGNPFKIGPDGTRMEVIEKYKELVRRDPRLIERIRKELRGHRLVCCCKPKPCHGDWLVEVAESEAVKTEKRGEESR